MKTYHVWRKKDKDGSRLYLRNNVSQKTATSLKYRKKNTINLGFYTHQNIFQKWRHYKDFFRHTLRNHYQHTRTTRNVKENTSGRRKIIPHKNLKPYKGMKSTKNGIYEIITFFSYLKNLFKWSLFKANK